MNSNDLNRRPLDWADLLIVVIFMTGAALAVFAGFFVLAKVLSLVFL